MGRFSLSRNTVASVALFLLFGKSKLRPPVLAAGPRSGDPGPLKGTAGSPFPKRAGAPAPPRGLRGRRGRVRDATGNPRPLKMRKFQISMFFKELPAGRPGRGAPAMPHRLSERARPRTAPGRWPRFIYSSFPKGNLSEE